MPFLGYSLSNKEYGYHPTPPNRTQTLNDGSSLRFWRQAGSNHGGGLAVLPSAIFATRRQRGVGIYGLRNRGPFWYVSILSGKYVGGDSKVEAYLDGLDIKLQPFLLVGEEFLHILALVSLELDHLSHLIVRDNGAIAS
jgi:hypothetical protein